MCEDIIRRNEGFGWGYNPITKIGESSLDTGINFGVFRMKAGQQKLHDNSTLECAYLLLQGEVVFSYSDKSVTVQRSSLFDDLPWAIHFSANSSVTIQAKTDCELAVFEVENERSFSTCVYGPETILDAEHRGKGLLDDTSYRIVRTIFDIRNRPESKMVLGEVVNFPGRWSSYPPHHHPQPEIYHYRFTLDQGYGHGELGETVYKIRQYDTLKILEEKDHAQTAAPGYGMYYIWVIRHLPDNPYTVPEFTQEHRWTMDKNAKAWGPGCNKDDNVI